MKLIICKLFKLFHLRLLVDKLLRHNTIYYSDYFHDFIDTIFQ